MKYYVCNVQSPDRYKQPVTSNACIVWSGIGSAGWKCGDGVVLVEYGMIMKEKAHKMGELLQLE